MIANNHTTYLRTNSKAADNRDLAKAHLSLSVETLTHFSMQCNLFAPKK